MSKCGRKLTKRVESLKLHIVSNPSDRKVSALELMFGVNDMTVYAAFKALNIQQSKRPDDCRG